MTELKVDAPLPDGITEKCYFALEPRTIAAFVRDNGLWAETREAVMEKLGSLPDAGQTWVLKVVGVTTAEQVPAKMRVRFTPTTSRARRAKPKATKVARRKVRASEAAGV